MKHVICDLDGVLWRGNAVLPRAGESLADLEAAGIQITFVTNNSTRSPTDVAEKITRLTSHVADPESVVTSSMAAAHLLQPDDGPVFVVGERGIDAAMAGRGIRITSHASKANTVVVGLCRSFEYTLLSDASTAIRAGARFVATNNDPTFPTSDGLEPGSGAIVAAIAAASGREPEIAGKPHQAMVDILTNVGISEAWVIGDRLDTDVALASNVPGWRSILVLTGVSASEDPKIGTADHVVADIRAAVDLVLLDPKPS